MKTVQVESEQAAKHAAECARRSEVLRAVLARFPKAIVGGALVHGQYQDRFFAPNVAECSNGVGYIDEPSAGTGACHALVPFANVLVGSEMVRVYDENYLVAGRLAEAIDTFCAEHPKAAQHLLSVVLLHGRKPAEPLRPAEG